MLIVVIAIMGCIAHAMAQSDEEDYYIYKFYEEEQERYNASLFDSEIYAPTLLPHAGAIPEISPIGEAGMRSVMNNPRGVLRSEERYMVGHLNINYTTSTALLSLGLKRQRYPGISHAIVSGSTAPTITFDLGHKSQRPHSGHYLRTEFSGLNYLVGINHRSTYRLSKGGVERDEDWLLAHSARIRVGRDIYVDGVYTNAADVALYATRSWSDNTLHLIASLPWSERGSRRATTQEAITLLNNPLYNPSWGYQAGKMRNANIATTLRPEVVAVWHRELGDNTQLSMAANLSYNMGGYTKLTNLKAPNPAPDNYRYLPSYFEDEAVHNDVTNSWINNNIRYTQIDWDNLYHTNFLQHDGHSIYLVDNSHINTLRGAITANAEHRIAGITLHLGMTLDYTSSHEFKSVEDLLGGSHILNLDYANEDDSSYAATPHNNLRDGDRPIYEGDHYAHDYRLTRYLGEIYGTIDMKFGQTSLAASLHVATELTQRRGYYEKSLFPGKGSYGKSPSIATYPYRLNLAWNHHLGKHNISASAMLLTRSPEVKDIFLQAQYNNRTVDNPRCSNSFTFETSYSFIGKRFSATATAYITANSHQTKVVHYYDDVAKSMADGVVTNIATINAGIEASAKAQWTRSLSSTVILTASQHRYTRNADVAIFSDVDNTILAKSTSHIKGLHTSTPEVTLYGDVEYRPTDTWLLRIAARYWGVRYTEASLMRRSAHILDITPSNEELTALMHQERLDDAVMVDLVATKSFRLKNSTLLMIQFSANNLLGNKAIYRSYEQNRVLLTATDSHTHITPFANMVQYAYPRTFRVMLSLWF